MINLQELEKKIDALLASETEESLRNWVIAQNNLNVDCYLGKGYFADEQPKKISFTVEHIAQQITLDEVVTDAGSTQYAMAA